MVYKKNLKHNTPLLEFRQLNDTAKDKARQEVIAIEITAKERKIKEARAKIAIGINAIVNNPYSAKTIINQINLIKKLQADTEYTDKFIQENICIFIESGDYVSFLSPPIPS